jgi:hypothetical protein
MPIISSINLNSTNGIQNTAFALSRDKIPDFNLNFEVFQGGTVNSLEVLQHVEELEVLSDLSLFEVETNSGTLLQRLQVQVSNIDLNLFDESEISDLTFNQIVGNVLPINNQTKLIQVPFLLEENFQSIILTKNLHQESSYSEYSTWLGQTYSGIQILNLNLDQFDADGPDLINLIPLSGSTFNNPNTNVSFDIFDSEGSAVVSGSLWLYANNLLLISGGVIVCPPTSGVVAYTRITNSLYHVEWNPSFAFNSLTNPVVISGVVQDNEIVPNVSYFNYNFSVWYTSDLSAMITGIPDTTPPYLLNLNPLALQAQVPVTSNVEFEILDDHTGLEPNSVTIQLAGTTVVLSGTPINSSYAVTTINTISGGNGRLYSINPVNNFNFSDLIQLDVYATDRYTVAPNILDTSYYFYTQTNDHLVASGLQVNVEGNYLDFNISNSLPIVLTGTEFKITYNNVLNLGINTSGSSISCNGVTISGLNFVSVSGNNIYDVYFTLVPNFTTDCDLVFRVEQDTLVSGNIVFNEFLTEVLWGAQFCYDPDTKFAYESDIPVIAQATDMGFLSNLTSMSYKFSTVPHPGNSLYAQVIGIEDFGAVSGSYVSNNPFFEYGKTMNLEFEVEDYAGNKLTYNWTFKIEEEGS